MKTKLASLGFAAIMTAVILSGCGSTEAQPGNGERVQDEDCLDADTGAKLSYEEAVDVAQGSECVEEGQLKETSFCNESTGTWWIDLDIDKPGCAPACVVSVSDRTAEINWRCTGLVPPQDEEDSGPRIIGEDNVPPSLPAPPVVQYEVTVRFSTSATQDDLSESEGVLRGYDDIVDYTVMESFPPVGRAVLSTDEADFCQTVQAELEAKSYVDGVTCGLWAEVGGVDPDAPVSSDPPVSNSQQAD